MTILPTTPPIADVWPSGHLIGKFEVREAVARGAWGVVYRAWDRDLGLAVAIKEHRPASLARREPGGDVVPTSPAQGAAYAASLQSFIQRTRALAHCDHPALVHVLQLEFGHGTAYRVMPWIDGEPMIEARRRLAQPPDERAVRSLLDDLLGALEAFHRTGNVHGGVHPSQVLLRRDDRAVLLGPAETVDPGAGPWTDLQGLAEVARFWIGGALPPSDEPSAEPLARRVERLRAVDRDLRYGDEFLRVLDAVASRDATQRPKAAAEFRDSLRKAERADARALAVVPAGVAVDGVGTGQGGARDPAVARLVEYAMSATSATPPPELILGPEFAPDATWHPPTPAPKAAAVAGPRWTGWAMGASAVGLLAVAWFSLRQPPGPSAASVASTSSASSASSSAPSAPPVVAAVDPASAAPPPAPSAPATEVAATAPPPAAAPPVTESESGAASAVQRDAAAEPARPPKAQRRSAPAPSAAASASRVAQSPRLVCGDRTQFSLYRCMQQQCARAVWLRHPQCVRLRSTDRVE